MSNIAETKFIRNAGSEEPKAEQNTLGGETRTTGPAAEGNKPEAADGSGPRDGGTVSEPPVEPALLTDKQDASASVQPKIQTGMVAVELLRPYARNKEIYGEADEPAFLENIRQHGVRKPLLVTPEGEILGGNRRWRGARAGGIAEVPVEVVAGLSDDQKLQHLIDDNLYREKTHEQKVREYIAQKLIEGREAAARKAAGGKKKGTGNEEGETLTPAKDQKKGKARDLAAEKFHLTGTTAEKGRKVVEAADKLGEKGDKKTAAELLAKLNDDGYTSALAQAMAWGLIPKPKSRELAKGSGQAKANNQKAEPTEKTSTALEDSASKADNIAPKAGATSSGLSNVRPPEKEAGDGQEAREDDKSSALLGHDDEQPLVVTLIATLTKAAADHEQLEVSELTADQKGNLRRAFGSLSDWYSNHEEMLKVPGQQS